MLGADSLMHSLGQVDDCQLARENVSAQHVLLGRGRVEINQQIVIGLAGHGIVIRKSEVSTLSRTQLTTHVGHLEFIPLTIQEEDVVTVQTQVSGEFALRKEALCH